jgi:hypothetical protein
MWWCDGRSNLRRIRSILESERASADLNAGQKVNLAGIERV